MTKRDNLIYGIRPVIEALKEGKPVDKIFFQAGLQGDLAKELLKEALIQKVPVQKVPLQKLNKLTFKNHQGVAAFLSEVEYYQIEDVIASAFENGKTPLVVILDRITDVRNFGAIARTAECAGADAILVPEYETAPVNSDALKTSAGALHYIPVCRARNLSQKIDYLKNSGLRIFACSEKGKIPYHKADFSNPTAIIMGSEEDGVSYNLVKSADETISIPVKGNIESLNVSVAAGIVLYEILKQRSE